jgi:hypothetical protein
VELTQLRKNKKQGTRNKKVSQGEAVLSCFLFLIRQFLFILSTGFPLDPKPPP